MLITQFMKSDENLNVPKTDEPVSPELCYKPSVVGTPYLKTMDIKYGRLTIIGLPFLKYHSINSKQRFSFVKAICDCGVIKEYRFAHLKNGYTKSCSCLQKDGVKERSTKHGLYKDKIYGIWHGMKTRCYDKNDVHYKRYGGRGIIVCDEWKNDFKSFYDWALKNGYKKSKSRNSNCQIDRINNDGNYEPLNCRWATSKVNARNRSNSLTREQVDGIRKLNSLGKHSQSEIAKIYSVSRSAVAGILTGGNWKD